MSAVEFIKAEEGLRLNAYLDQAGIPTIGYGHTKGVKMGQTITAEQAEAFLREDMDWAIRAVDGAVKVPITKEQHAALVSLTYNIGSAGFRSSTALRRLNAGDYEGAAEAITRWNKVTINGKKMVSNGLRARRERERALFLSNMPGEDGTVSGPVTGGEQKSPAQSKTILGSLAGLGTLLGALVPSFSTMDWRTAGLLVGVGGLFAYLAFNRWLEARRGEH
jgi:lysozyme